MATNKISIVFEETGEVIGGDHTFNVYLEGMTPERRKEIDALSNEAQMHELSTAEFWALRCFQIVVGNIQQANAVTSIKRRER
jgi:hypothetical protein